MYTRCPHCQTVFKVTARELGLAHGKVRCGRCLQVFVALDRLYDQAGDAWRQRDALPFNHVAASEPTPVTADTGPTEPPHGETEVPAPEWSGPPHHVPDTEPAAEPEDLREAPADSTAPAAAFSEHPQDEPAHAAEPEHLWEAPAPAHEPAPIEHSFHREAPTDSTESASAIPDHPQNEPARAAAWLPAEPEHPWEAPAPAHEPAPIEDSFHREAPADSTAPAPAFSEHPQDEPAHAAAWLPAEPEHPWEAPAPAPAFSEHPQDEPAHAAAWLPAEPEHPREALAPAPESVPAEDQYSQDIPAHTAEMAATTEHPWEAPAHQGEPDVFRPEHERDELFAHMRESAAPEAGPRWDAPPHGSEIGQQWEPLLPGEPGAESAPQATPDDMAATPHTLDDELRALRIPLSDVSGEIETGLPLRADGFLQPERHALPRDGHGAAKHEPPRRLSVFGWAVGVLLLLALLVGQAAYFFRSELVAYPELRPHLEQFCAYLHCDLPLQRDVGAVALVERDMRSHPTVPDALLVNAVMVNRAPFAQPYPDLSLTLSNLQGEIVAARRFTPPEYLDRNLPPDRMMPPEKPVLVVLELTDPGNSAVSFEFDFLDSAP